MIAKVPSRVDSVTAYWTEPPPETSQRCLLWQKRIRAGWRPNRRIRGLGYHEKAEFFGVYIWEYLNVLSPMLSRFDDVSSASPASTDSTPSTS